MAIINGTPQDDTLSGTPTADAIFGDAGDDELWGSGGSDTLDGGAGSDTLIGNDDGYDDSLDAHRLTIWRDTARYDWATTSVVANLGTVTGEQTGTDELHGIDNLWTGAGRDTLYGSGGANELRGGAGGDALHGEGGDDTLWGQGGNDTLDGGDGSDTAVYSDNRTSLRVDLAAQRVTFVGQSWPAESLVSFENAVGGAAADTLLGTAGANVLEGGGGADRIDGRGGLDTVSFLGAARGVLIDLAAQRSGTLGSAVRDTLVSIESGRGGAGNDKLVGNAAANVLDGGNGADTLRGAGGNDTLILFSGNDCLDGGAGTDTLILHQPYETYTNGYHQFDISDYGVYSWSFDGPTDVTARIDLADSATLSYGGTGTSKVANIENVSTGVGNDHVFGSAAANVISVDHGANCVDGRGGNDTVHGSNVTLDDDPWDSSYRDYRDAGEIVRGGDGNDRIVGATHAFGDAGNDTLVAGWHYQQEMTGGAGADRFEFSDAYEYEMYHGPAWYDQSGSVLDYNRAEGDRLVIDRVDDQAPAPIFEGAVASTDDLDVNSYGLVGNTIVYVAYKGVDEWDYDFVIGPSIGLVGFTGTLAADDVLFV
jgi:Ca2+-binding RTX toxin-like protein